MTLAIEFMHAHYLRANVKQDEGRRGDIVLDVTFKKLSGKKTRFARQIIPQRFTNHDTCMVPDKTSVKIDAEQNTVLSFVFRSTLKSDVEFLSERFTVIDNHNILFPPIDKDAHWPQLSMAAA